MITAAKAQKLMKELIDTTPANTKLSQIDLEFTFLEYLFSLSRYARHVNCDFIIKMNHGYCGRRYKGLCLITENSNFHLPITAKSLKTTTTTKPKNTRAAVLAALREAICYQIDEFRLAEKEKRKIGLADGNCPVTSKKLTSKSHVDHFPISFIELADNWLESQNLTGYSELTLKRGQLFGNYLYNWQNFHLATAKLRLVSASANIAAGSRGYKSKFKH